VATAVDQRSFDEAIEPLDDLIILAGCLSLSRRLMDKEKLADALAHFLLIGRVSSAIDQ
jgi:hypothetical protein